MKRGGKWRFVCISIDGGKKWLALQATEVEECLIEQHRNHYRINYFGIKDDVFQVKGAGPTVLGYLLCRSESNWSGSDSVLRPCQWGPALDPWFRSLCPNSVEKAMATRSTALAWKMPWIEEPSRLQSMGSMRVRHDWATSLSLFTFMHWRRKWQPTPVFLPGESQGWVSLVGCRLWGCTESDTTEVT